MSKKGSCVPLNERVPRSLWKTRLGQQKGAKQTTFRIPGRVDHTLHIDLNQKVGVGRNRAGGVVGCVSVTGRCRGPVGAGPQSVVSQAMGAGAGSPLAVVGGGKQPEVVDKEEINGGPGEKGGA